MIVVLVHQCLEYEDFAVLLTFTWNEPTCNLIGGIA